MHLYNVTVQYIPVLDKKKYFHIGLSNMTMQVVNSSKYIPILYSIGKMNN